jgi:small subunit ribosomal protein S20
MANTKSAKKRVRKIQRRTLRNTSIKAQVKTAVRGAKESLAAKQKDAQGKISEAVSLLSKAAKRGTIHKRNAARKISRLMKRATAAVSSK